MVFLSIIIPIYNNSEEELSACLSSIRRLSKKISYEVLLIDDGSDIDHNNIYSKLIEGEKNIKLYRTINSGAAAARNFGVKKAIGNYIFFVDADDILPVQFVQDVSCIKNYQYDIIYGLVHFVEERSAINDKICEEAPLKVIDLAKKKNLVYQHMIDLSVDEFRNSLGYLSRGPVARLVRNDVAKNSLFPEDLVHGEDTIWNMRILSASKKIAIVMHPWYYYIRNGQSITHRYDCHFVEWQKNFLLQIIPYAEKEKLYRCIFNRIFESIKSIADQQFLTKENQKSFFYKMREFNSIVQEYPFNLLHDLYRKKEINIWEIKKFFKYQLYKHNWLFIIYQAKNIILNLRRL